MTKTQWDNILRCAKERRMAEGLHGHWSHWDMPRFHELVSTEFTAQRMAHQTRSDPAGPPTGAFGPLRACGPGPSQLTDQPPCAIL
jgi:hypothetical protein